MFFKKRDFPIKITMLGTYHHNRYVFLFFFKEKNYIVLGAL